MMCVYPLEELAKSSFLLFDEAYVDGSRVVSVVGPQATRKHMSCIPI